MPDQGPKIEPSAPNGAWARRRVRIGGEIERVALGLFADRGPDNVTVEEIAEAAGISVRTFFRYFPSRDDVMSALPRRHVADLSARVAARPEDESVLDGFIAAVHEAAQDFADDDLMRLWGRAVDRWEAANAELPADNPMLDSYGAVIAARLGAPIGDLRVQVLATAIASVMWLAFLRWVATDDGRTLPEFVEDCIQVLRDLDRHATPPRSVSG